MSDLMMETKEVLSMADLVSWIYW